MKRKTIEQFELSISDVAEAVAYWLENYQDLVNSDRAREAIKSAIMADYELKEPTVLRFAI